MSKMTTSLSENMKYLNKYLSVDTSFDIIYRVIRIGGREACMYLIDGFCKDDLMQKMLQYFITIKEEDMPDNAHEMSKTCIPCRMTGTRLRILLCQVCSPFLSRAMINVF